MTRRAQLEPPLPDRTSFGPAWRRQMAARAQPKLACDLRPGIRGKVSGTAQAMRAPLRSPFTDTPCVFWCVEIVRRELVPVRGAVARIMRRRREEWTFVVAESSPEPFLIADASGERVLVDPKNALVSMTRGAVAPPSFDSAIGALLLRHGTTPREIRSDTSLEWFESILVPEARASAWGIVTSVSEITANGYRDASFIARRIASTQIDLAVILDV